MEIEGAIHEIPSYNIKPEIVDLVIAKLARRIIYSDKHLMKEIKNQSIKDAVEPMMKFIKPEIKRIFSAIKKVGFSGRLNDAETNWREAALTAYGDSKKGFRFLRREYLEDKELYFFTGGQGKRDFESKLYRKIIAGLEFGNYGGQRLWKLFQKIKAD